MTTTTRTNSAIAPMQDWRCTKCFRLLGKCQQNGVFIQFARGHRYRATRPVTAVCRHCGILNET